MKNRLKRIGAIVLAAILTLNIMPLAAIADATEGVSVLSGLLGAGAVVEQRFDIANGVGGPTQEVTVRGINGQQIDPGSPKFVTGASGLNMDNLVAVTGTAEPYTQTSVAYFAVEGEVIYPCSGSGTKLTGTLVALDKIVATLVTADATVRDLARTTTYDMKGDPAEQYADLVDGQTPAKITANGEEGDTFDLSNLYGQGTYVVLDASNTLVGKCTQVKIQKNESTDTYSLVPLVDDVEVTGAIGKVIDEQYAFSNISTVRLPQQFAEDDGRAWLWKGNKEEHMEDGATAIKVAGRIGQIYYPSSMPNVDQGIMYMADGAFEAGPTLIGRDRKGQRPQEELRNYKLVSIFREKVAYFRIDNDGNGGAKLTAILANGGSETVGDGLTLYVPLDSINTLTQDIGHVNVRLDANVVYVDDEDGKVYSGTLQSMDAPKIKVMYNEKEKTTGQLKRTDNNEYERSFSSNVPRADATDASKVTVTIEYKYAGTLTAGDGAERKVTVEDTKTLTSAELAAGLAACPNNWGYDVVIDVSKEMSVKLPDDDVTITVTKVWDDANYDKRPKEIKLTLGRSVNGVTDGTWSDDNVQLHETNALQDNDNVWAVQVKNLEKKNDKGERYTYFIKKERFNGNLANEYNAPVYSGLTVTNTREYIGTKSIEVIKDWVDNDNVAEKRPTSVTVLLYRNNYLFDQAEVTQKSGWKTTFSDLRTHDGKGNPYIYMVDEEAVPDYRKTSIERTTNGFKITNTLNLYKVTYNRGDHGNLANQDASGDVITRDLPLGAETPAAPVVTPDDGYYFTGWDKAISPTVTGNITYTALYDEKGSITVSLANLSVPYDGAEHSLAAPTITGAPAGVTLTTLNAAVSGGQGTNANEYPATFNDGRLTSYTDASGKVYDVAYRTATLTITLKPVTVTANTLSKVYGADDPAETLNATVVGTLGEDTVSYTVSREEGEAVRSYVITPTGEQIQGNYTVSYTTGSLTIDPRPVTFKITDESKPYDRTALNATMEEVATGADTGLVSGHRLDATKVVLIGNGLVESGSNAVTFDATASTDYIVDATGASVLGNYSVTVQPGSVTITSLTYTVRYFYDGVEDTAAMVTVGTPALGDEITTYEDKSNGDWLYETTGLPLTIGTDAATNVINVYYRSYGAINVSLTGLTLPFNNQQQTLDAPVITTTPRAGVTRPVVTLEALNARVTGGVGTAAGDYPADFEALTPGTAMVAEYTQDDGAGKVGERYRVTYTPATLTITPVTDEVVVTIVGANDTRVYDASVHGVSGYDVTISNPLYTEANFTFSGTATASRTDEGTTNMGLVPGQFTNTNMSFTNVRFEVTDGYQTINLRPVTFKITDESKPYDRTALNATMEEVATGADTGLVSGHRLDAAKVVLIGNGLVESGSNAVTFDATASTDYIVDATGASVLGNYSVTVQSGSVTITSLTYTVHYFYDGVEDAAALVTVGTPALGDEITTYEDKNDGNWWLYETTGLPLTIGTDAATNVINVYYRSYGAINVSLTGLTLPFNNQQQTLDAPVITTTPRAGVTRPVVTLEALNARVTGGVGTAAGDYPADFEALTPGTAMVAEYTQDDGAGKVGERYRVTYTPATLTILNLSVRITPDDVDEIYNGASHGFLNATMTSADDNPIPAGFTFTYDTPEYVDANRYENQVLTNVRILDAELNDVTDNITLEVVPGVINVNRRPVTLKISDETRAFDGYPLYASMMALGTPGMGLVTGHRLDAASYSLEGNGLIDPGYSPVTLSDLSGAYLVDGAGASVMGNYDITVLPGSVTITPIDTAYTVYYYYDGVLYPGNTEYFSGTIGEEIYGYAGKPFEGMRLAGVEGLPLTLSGSEDANVINVYYESVDAYDIIVDLETPLAGSFMNATVGDCLE